MERTFRASAGWSPTHNGRSCCARSIADQVAAKIERDGWETRVYGLRPHHLNPDTLDERARAMLNLADPSDVIVKLGPQDKLF